MVTAFCGFYLVNIVGLDDLCSCRLLGVVYCGWLCGCLCMGCVLFGCCMLVWLLWLWFIWLVAGCNVVLL